MTQVWVLYEDQRNDNDDFGLHQMLLRCVADARTDVTHWQLKKLVSGVPKKANSNVLQACRTELVSLTRTGGSVVAVYDADRAHELVPPCRRGECKRRICAALGAGCSPADRLVVVLLVQNTETLLALIRRLAPSLVSQEQFETALRHRGSRGARDLIFSKAASNADLRRQIQAENPSFGRLVQVVARLLPIDR
jgi:hypothetical protein